MWEKYELGSSRPISIPSDLMKAMDRYCERTGVQNPEIFDTALLRLWNIWNGHNHNAPDPNIPINQEAIDVVTKNLRFNPPPKNNGSKDTIWISFKGKYTFHWVQMLEQDHAIIRCTEDFIRRLLSWFLREEGFLKKL
jgi:hypothetical protein